LHVADCDVNREDIMSASATERHGRVAGKVVLITGGARGQGANHARVLAQEGAQVFIGDVLDEQGEKVAASLRENGLSVRYCHLDVTQPREWDAAVRDAERAFGRLNVLVNNAGIFPSASLLDCSLEEWQQVIAVNQTGPFLGMKSVASAMRRAGGGSIINIISVAGTLATEIAVAYAVSKAALLMLTRTAAVTLAPTIRVNSITPGIIDTDMMRQLDPERLKVRLAQYPMLRAGTVDEVSKAILFLASDESSFTTGADLRVDGGALAGVRVSPAR
jgi:3alpha(or 20beta)-hydroxysteroid dehydrogenase